MLLDHLHAQRNAIEELGRRYGARRMRVFGSVARRQDRSDSDVDILVEFDRGYDLFAQRLPLTRGLSDLLGRNVDLVPEHELNQHLRDRILAEAVAL
jgi:predicted nucleotidyltransferase